MDLKVLEQLSHCIDKALQEDDAHNDITSIGCLPNADPIEAKLYLNEGAFISGIAFLPQIFYRFDPDVRVQINTQEGEYYEKGTILAQIVGNPKAILSLERTFINLIAHLSGITHLTARYVEAVREFDCDILDTLNTLPGLRFLQKYAVRMGGGKNHRLSLSDKIFIKDNHLTVLRKCSSLNLIEAASHARQRYPGAHVVIEVSHVDFLGEALVANPDSILLDHMKPEDVREAVIRAKDQPDLYLEASGVINLDNVKEYAGTGVNGISISALTQSAPAISMSLKM